MSYKILQKNPSTPLLACYLEKGYVLFPDLERECTIWAKEAIC